MNAKPVCLAQIGCGYWGPNLLRNFSALSQCAVKYVVEASDARRRYVAGSFPATCAVPSIDTALQDPEVNAVAIATPAGTHFNLARQCLKAGKHVFVEKPIATAVAEVDELAELAAASGLVLMVGHTFLYNDCVLYIKKLLDSGELGEVRYIYSQRLNLGRIRSDIDALWNFAPHDLSIIQFWLNDVMPLRVSRTGMDYIQSGIEDVVFLNVEYPGKVVANIHVSWLDPNKTRKMVIVGSRKMVVYDDIADEKVAIYDKGIDRHAIVGENMDYDRQPPIYKYRSGDLVFPSISASEPLRNEAAHFIECIIGSKPPRTGAKHARAVVHILEQAASVAQKR